MIVVLLFATSLVVARAQESIVARARAGGHVVKRWGGAVLVVVGGWFVALAVWAEELSSLFTV